MNDDSIFAHSHPLLHMSDRSINTEGSEVSELPDNAPSSEMVSAYQICAPSEPKDKLKLKAIQYWKARSDLNSLAASIRSSMQSEILDQWDGKRVLSGKGKTPWETYVSEIKAAAASGKSTLASSLLPRVDEVERLDRKGGQVSSLLGGTLEQCLLEADLPSVFTEKSARQGFNTLMDLQVSPRIVTQLPRPSSTDWTL